MAEEDGRASARAAGSTDLTGDLRPPWDARPMIPAEAAEWHAASEEGARQRGKKKKPQGGEKQGDGRAALGPRRRSACFIK